MGFHKAKVVPRVNCLVKSKTEKKEISKMLQFIFVFFHILFALDNGFIQSDTPRKKLLLKLCTFLHFLLIGSYSCYGFIVYEYGDELVLVIAPIYIIFALVLLSSKYSYYDFLNDLNSFDKEINVDHLLQQHRLDLRIIASVTLILFYLVSQHVIWFDSYEDNEKIIAHISLFSCILGSGVVTIIYFLVFSSACWRIKKFIEFVKENNVDIVACQNLYKNIADITEKARANFNIVSIVTLIYNLVAITGQIFLPFAEGTVKSESATELLSDFLNVVKNLFIMLAPSFTAGLLSAEVEKLVLELRDKVLFAKDEKQRVDIRRFIGYIEARPLKFTVCGVVPLDWNLPLIIVNMFFTYLIVMIQFTHKY